jgi:hypothetical protein
MNEAKSAAEIEAMLTYVGRKVAGLVEELEDVLPRRVGRRFGEALDREYGHRDSAVDGAAVGVLLNKQIDAVRIALEQAGGSAGVATGTMQEALHRASKQRGEASQSLVL